MEGSRKPPGPRFAYASALLIAAASVAGGGGLAMWFRTHPGAPPPIIVVAEAPAASSSPVPTTHAEQTTAPKAARPAEPVFPTLPDDAAYTAAPPSARPGFADKSANQYGWFSGDGRSARCDEWNRATVVGSTAQTLFVVCGSYFKAYELATGTPIRIGISGGGGAWVGAGTTISVHLTIGELTMVRDGDPVVQPVVEWWQP
ncbi:hypothetical protein [Nocardia inohanensis]|uniref:hypothetical protein n=1 Tax=Nocardia inohanensis TaxID=209246 RepID=UPI000834ED47|nr:hypothetical protein [Nocardia inohanensis]